MTRLNGVKGQMMRRPAAARRRAAGLGDSKKKELERSLERQLTWAGHRDFEMQFYYARELGRQFRADVAFPAAKLLVEIEGGIFTEKATGHRSISGVKNDLDRANHAAIMGYRVVRVHCDHINDGRALDIIEQALYGPRALKGGPPDA